MTIKLPEGVFIVIEGIDGSGQDTQADLLRDYLIDLGANVLRTAEPTDGRVGKMIRQILSGEKDNPGALVIQRMMVKDRGIHLQETIYPHLDRDGVVVCVRYLYSTLVYGQADGVSYDELLQMNESFSRPDLAIYLDLDPKISLQRVEERAKRSGKSLDIFEKQGFLVKVRENFLKLVVDFPEMVKIDASGTPEEVHLKIITHVKLLFNTN